jgi:hypothetical protein
MSFLMHISCSYTNNFLQVFWLLICDDVPCRRNMLHVWKYKRAIRSAGRSQWPLCLRRGSAACRGFESRRGHGFVSYECCVLLGRGLCVRLITRPEESYWIQCVVMCDLETSSRMRRPWPTGECCAPPPKKSTTIYYLYKISFIFWQ